MKKMMNTLLSMLICTVLFSTCFGATTVCAAPSGKIEIQLKDLNTAHSNKTGVTFKLYLVGTVLDSGEPVIDPVYGITEYPVTADETEQAVKKIKVALTGSAQASAATDASGKAVFSGVADGIYYIAADESNGYGIVEPLLVQIPYSVEGTGEGNHLVWEVSAEPKASDRPPKPGKPSDNKKHPSSDHPDNAPASLPEADTTTGINGPRTGDNSPLAGYAIMIVSASLLIIWLAGRMKKLREYKHQRNRRHLVSPVSLRDYTKYIFSASDRRGSALPLLQYSCYRCSGTDHSWMQPPSHLRYSSCNISYAACQSL